jgi:methylated-DNA-[protein]-cysteine S-methyltransferase
MDGADSMSSRTMAKPSKQPDLRRYTALSSPVGELLLIDDGGQLAGLEFDNDGKRRAKLPSQAEGETSLLREAVKQLKAYFAGKRRDFDLPLAPAGTEFQRRVWDALCNIPYGETISYAELARRVESPRACRAVGSANGSNPIAVIIPCHRVIASNGSLGGYGGGLDRKQWLLELESPQQGHLL